MKFSLVMSTLGRFEEVVEFIDSLQKLKHKDIELIIVDQNEEDKLQQMCSALKVEFPFYFLRTPHEKGASRGRNTGISKATGDVVCFPDDDCVYPPDLLNRVIEVFEKEKVDIVCGRASAPDGRSINGRFETSAQSVDRKNVFTTQIEWTIFFKREVFDRVVGFDQNVGVGASTPWQSCEGPDITLRALSAGYSVYYHPEVYAFHPELNIVTPDDAMIQKGRRYARGMGYVFKKHNYRFLYFSWYLVRPFGGALLALSKLRVQRARYYVQVIVGRLEGYYGISFGK